MRRTYTSLLVGSLLALTGCGLPQRQSGRGGEEGEGEGPAEGEGEGESPAEGEGEGPAEGEGEGPAEGEGEGPAEGEGEGPAEGEGEGEDPGGPCEGLDSQACEVREDCELVWPPCVPCACAEDDPACECPECEPLCVERPGGGCGDLDPDECAEADGCEWRVERICRGGEACDCPPPAPCPPGEDCPDPMPCDCDDVGEEVCEEVAACVPLGGPLRCEDIEDEALCEARPDCQPEWWAAPCACPACECPPGEDCPPCECVCEDEEQFVCVPAGGPEQEGCWAFGDPEACDAHPGCVWEEGEEECDCPPCPPGEPCGCACVGRPAGCLDDLRAGCEEVAAPSPCDRKPGCAVQEDWACACGGCACPDGDPDCECEEMPCDCPDEGEVGCAADWGWCGRLWREEDCQALEECEPRYIDDVFVHCEGDNRVGPPVLPPDGGGDGGGGDDGGGEAPPPPVPMPE